MLGRKEQVWVWVWVNDVEEGATHRYTAYPAIDRKRKGTYECKERDGNLVLSMSGQVQIKRTWVQALFSYACLSLAVFAPIFETAPSFMRPILYTAFPGCRLHEKVASHKLFDNRGVFQVTSPSAKGLKKVEGPGYRGLRRSHFGVVPPIRPCFPPHFACSSSEL